MSYRGKRLGKLLGMMMVALTLAFGAFATNAVVSPTVAAAKTKAVSKSKAIKIALKDAGFKKSQVKKLKAEKDTEDGVKVWEVEFRRGSYKYEYDINRKTGKIEDKDVDRIKSAKTSSTKKAISKSKAIKIALKDAGFKKSKVKKLKAEKDTEDGVKVWKVEFLHGGYEYEYDINRKTGKIVDKEVERA